MRHRGISDKILIFRLLGALTITNCLANAEGSCILFEDMSKGYPETVLKEVGVGANITINCCLIKKLNDDTEVTIKEGTSTYQTKKVNENETELTMTDIKYREEPYNFYCMYDKKAFKNTNVRVGTVPEKVKDFTCVAIDLAGINCKVKVKHNTISTKYTFFLDETEILAEKEYTDLIEYQFNLTKPQYKSDHQFYMFVINSENILKNDTESKTIDQYTIAKPRLLDVHITNITSNSIVLTWNIPNYDAFKNFTNGVVYNISLKEVKSDLVINGHYSIENQGGNHWIKISNLHTFLEYRLNLRVKAKSTPYDEIMWSEQFEETFKTSATRPNNSPQIDIGNFYIHPGKKSISLFWQQIPEIEQNGPNFVYELYEIRKNKKIITPSVKIVENSALVNIDWENTSQYEFKLKSRNDVGDSLNSSVLKISPRYKNIIHTEPINTITKLYDEENQIYNLSWVKPINFTALSSFTLFWCNSRKTYHQCEGPMNFTKLNRSTFNYITDRINKNEALNFALSENYYNNTYSSGMMWAECFQNIQTYSFQLKNLKAVSTENSIEVLWNTECWHRTIIDRYNVTYNANNTTKFNNKIIPNYVERYKIHGLEPSTEYIINIKPVLKIAKAKILKSKPVKQTTKKAKNTAGVILVASSSIIGVVAFIMLVYFLYQKIKEWREIPDPQLTEDSVETIEADMIDRKNLVSSRYEDDLLPLQLAHNSCSSLRGAELVEPDITPKEGQAKEQPIIAINTFGYICNNVPHYSTL